MGREKANQKRSKGQIDLKSNQKAVQDEENSRISDHEEEHSNFFSDENSKWLKPKREAKTLLSDDESAVGDESDDQLEIELESRKLDSRKHEEEEEAKEEFRERVLKDTSTYHLPTNKEIEEDVDRVIPPSELRSHIDSILEVLSNFNERRQVGRTRSEYVERLVGFTAELYGYLPELVEYFFSMFSPSEAVEFIEYSDKPRPLVIRTNTLKTRRKDLALALMKRGVTLDPLSSWSKVGLKILESPVPIGATPEYLSGQYMLQSAASMCPVLALAPEPRERVLDLSAAPGGKTSYIAQLMRNTGIVFANDLRPDRQKATVANMHRLGVKNVVACSHDGRKMTKLFSNYKFDRVLLDAPCSGLGVISRDPSCKVQRTIADVQKTAHLQKELLLAAIDLLNHKSKTGGVMVYSTCSVSVAENEEVVNYALSKRDIKILETGLDFGKPGFTRYQQKRFHPSVALTRRFYPHVHNMDGFYVCKIQKLSDKKYSVVKEADDVGTSPANTTGGKKREKVTQPGKQAKKVDTDEKQKKRKRSSKSFPPVNPTKAARRKGAKVSKPRRPREDNI